MERRHCDDLLRQHPQFFPIGGTRRGILPFPPECTLQYPEKHLHHSLMVTAGQMVALMNGIYHFHKAIPP